MFEIRLKQMDSLAEETFEQFRLNSPPDGWFPAVQKLTWYITKSNLPYAYMFFSLHLKSISIHAAQILTLTGCPSGLLPTLTSIISTLPTSSLQFLSVNIPHLGELPRQYFTDSMSSVILRCGSSLTTYNSSIPLSKAAVNHLIQLPNLHSLLVRGPPPDYPASSLPLVFPPLTDLHLAEGAAHGWLRLLERLDGTTSTIRGVIPLSEAKESLKFLHVQDPPGFTIDASLIPPVRNFRNLTVLDIDTYCGGGKDRCAFKLNNDNIAELAAALPQLQSLLLGHACSRNSCVTSAACLLSISVHCVKLESLEIHFNTTHFVEDLKNISNDPRFEQILSLPRSSLRYLDVYDTPVTLHDHDFETVVKEMVGIFPSLRGCEGYERGWYELSRRLRNLQEDRPQDIVGECDDFGFLPRLMHIPTAD